MKTQKFFLQTGADFLVFLLNFPCSFTECVEFLSSHTRFLVDSFAGLRKQLIQQKKILQRKCLVQRR